MKKNVILVAILLMSFTTAFSQLGVRVGVNMANEIRDFGVENVKKSFDSNNLTGFQVGLIYQANPSHSGLGLETGVLFCQKGGQVNIDKNSVVNTVIEGYNQVNYFEVPLNLRYKLAFTDILGAYASAGVYGGIAINGVTDVESKLKTLKKEAHSFNDFTDRIDYGFSFGLGVELIRKIQIGVNWSEGLKKIDTNKKLIEVLTTNGYTIKPNFEPKTKNRVFSVSLTYML